MIMKVFSVYDKKVQAYLPPFFARSNGEALRSFEDAVNNPEHVFAKHVSDFSLYSFGEWDDSSGLFACGDPTLILAGLQAVQDVVVPPAGSRSRMPM